MFAVDDFGVLIAHRDRGDFTVVFTVASERVTRVATVEYAGAMFSFFGEDPAAGRLWPVAGDNHLEASVALVRELLLGRGDVDMRRGLLFRRLRSYLVDDSSERELIQREVWVASRPLLPTSDIVRVDFGATTAGGPRREG